MTDNGGHSYTEGMDDKYQTQDINRSEKIDLLERYTKFLQKHGYMDTDATCEEPYAIDEFLKEDKS